MLTDRQIRDAKPKSSVYRLRDENVVCRGFGVVVAPTGTKTFFLSYTSPEDGKRKQVSIGRFPAMPLKEARLKAGTLREKINEGQDPAANKQTDINNRLEKRTLGTFGDLLDLYVADLETDGKRSASEVKRIMAKDIPHTLRARPAYLITKDDILDILAPIAQRGAPVHSDHVRAYLRAAFELGIHAESMTRWRGRTKKFDIKNNPVASVKKTVHHKPRGTRALSRQEVHQVWNSNALTPPMLLAVKLLLATGQRVEEVLHATWREFDRDQMVWLIPGERRKSRSKTLEPHVVPLTEFHIRLLDHIKHETKDNIYLFPARRVHGPRRFDALTNAVRKLVRESKLESFSPRDMRRTFKTLTGSIGISVEMRNRLQGHAITDVGSLHYDRYDYLTEKRIAMEAWTTCLAEIVEVRK